MSKDFIPGTDAGKLVWTQNLEDKLSAYAASLGLTAADVTANQNLCKGIRKAITDKIAAQATAKKARETGDLTVANNTKQLRTAIQAWKQKSTFTAAIAADLQLQGITETVDTNTFKTTLTTHVFSGRIAIDFVKKGVEGVNIYTRLKGQPGWQKLSYDAHSPYIDTRPLAQPNTPEHREYQAIGVLNDAEVGLPSDIVEVVFAG